MIQVPQQQHPLDAAAASGTAVTVFQLSQDHLSGGGLLPANKYAYGTPHHHDQHAVNMQNAYTPSPPLTQYDSGAESHYSTLQLEHDYAEGYRGAHSRCGSPAAGHAAPELPARNGTLAKRGLVAFSRMHR